MSRITGMFQGEPEYIVTDPDSDFPLEPGKRYFMDFDISESTLFEHVLRTPFEEFRILFVNRMYEQGHTVQDTVVSLPGAFTIRFTFTVLNVPPLFLAIAIAVGVILVAAGIGGGVFVMFKGLGETLPSAVEMPTKILESAVKNPIAVIAIVGAVGIFVLKVKL